MPERVSTYLEEDTLALIREIADHHDISRSKAVQLLVREGISNRSLRYQYELLDAKMDRILLELGIDNIDDEIAQDRYEFALKNTTPESTLDTEFADTPQPEFVLGNLGYNGGPDEEQAKRSRTED
jgi:hypothetical protein